MFAVHSLIDAKLKRLDPSVHCSNNSMTLRVKRVKAPHFLVNSGEFCIKSLEYWPTHCVLLELFKCFSNVKQEWDLLLLCPRCPPAVASL